MNEEKEVSTEFKQDEEYEPLMPEGWTDGADFFNPDSWAAGENAGDASQDDSGADEGDNSGSTEEAAPTTEQAGAETETDEAEQAPTTEQGSDDGKLHFQVKFDRAVSDVELDPKDLPGVYQKSMALERFQNRASVAEAELSEWDKIAKALNYGGRAELLRVVTDNAVSAYLDDHPGVPEDMARDYLGRKFELNTTSGGSEGTDTQQTAATQERDYKSEVSELFTAYPDLRGTGVPKEVTSAAVVENKPLVQAYAEYRARALEAEASSMRRENKILKQNQAAAAKAPVSKVTGGGKTDTSPQDDFLAGFNSRNY